MPKFMKNLQALANRDFTEFGLHVAITLWALAIIVASWLVRNKWILAGIFAYVVL